MFGFSVHRAMLPQLWIYQTKLPHHGRRIRAVRQHTCCKGKNPTGVYMLTTIADKINLSHQFIA